MAEDLDLNVDMEKMKDPEEYKKFWKRLSAVEIKMVEKNEVCRHNLGDVFIYESPLKKPEKLCGALMYIIERYIWLVALGVPSWYDDPSVYKIHCPDAKGTVWELRKIKKPAK
jgi:uncharacterized repeat protein (TIGR04076 family)